MGDGDELIIDSPINHNVLHKQYNRILLYYYYPGHFKLLFSCLDESKVFFMV